MPLSLTLTSDNGSVPPRFRKSTCITLREDGTGTEEHTRGYSGGTTTTRDFRLGSPEALADRLAVAGLWRTAWREPEPQPVGGSGASLKATWNGEAAHVPRSVVAEQRDLKAEIIAIVRDAVSAA
ncbi:MAG: hypothetical protein AAFQ43_02190 [Bacteroidota bacterium]